MRHIRITTTLLVVLLWIATAYVQLSPKDGANLRPTDLERIKISDTAPDFTLESMDGKRIILSDFRGKKNVVLVF